MTQHNLHAGIGETFSIDIVYKDANGAPINLTGYTASLQVLEKDTGTVITTQAGTVDASGNITVRISDSVTATWNAGTEAYVLVLTNPSAEKKWLLNGKLDIRGAANV